MALFLIQLWVMVHVMSPETKVPYSNCSRITILLQMDSVGVSWGFAPHRFTVSILEC